MCGERSICLLVYKIHFIVIQYTCTCFKRERETEMFINIPASTHDVARLLKSIDFLTGQTDFSSSWDSLTLCDVGSHSCTFTRQQCFTIAVKRK